MSRSLPEQHKKGFYFTPNKAWSAYTNDHSTPLLNEDLGHHRNKQRLMWRDRFLKAPAKDFLDTCVPCAALDNKPAPNTKNKFKNAFNGVPSKPKVERNLYNPICNAVNELCEGYVCRPTSENWDPSDPLRHKVDLALYPAEDAPEDHNQHWDKQALNIEVKLHPTEHDPFDDGKGKVFQLGVEKRAGYRDQITSYADMLFKTQHRAYCFTVVVFSKYARIIRWDRSGAIVTEKIDYKKHPEQLAVFFWRFAHMTKAEQGYDTTVTTVERSSQDYRRMERAKSKPPKTAQDIDQHARELFAQSLADADTVRLKIRVEAETVGESSPKARAATRPRDFLVGKPHYMWNGIIGRCTRGYVALDVETDEFVWLKDAWRVDLEDVEKEGDTLRALNAKSVPNVPTFVCHGDVPGQSTLADKMWRKFYAEAPLASAKSQDDSAGSSRAGPSSTEGGPTTEPPMTPLKAHTHYRLVTKEVCLPLDAFKDGQELFMIVRDCVIAHQQAYNLLSLLHRDVSIGNMLIFVYFVKGKPRRRGILADWELAKVVPKGEGVFSKRRMPDRTGTWQFMSALSLLNSLKPLTVHDDLESFHHAIVFQGSQWLPSNLPNVTNFMLEYFDDKRIHEPTSEYICGLAKFTSMELGVLNYHGKAIVFGGSKDYPFNYFLDNSFDLFSSYYRIFRHDYPLFYTAPNAQGVEHVIENDGSPKAKSAKGAIPAILARGVNKRKMKEVAGLLEARATAQLLDDHKQFLGVLNACIASPGWSPKDKLHEDQRRPVKLPEQQAHQLALSGVSLSRSGVIPVAASAPGGISTAGMRQPTTSVPHTGSSTSSLKRLRNLSMSGDRGDTSSVRQRLMPNTRRPVSPDSSPVSSSSPADSPPTSVSARASRSSLRLAEKAKMSSSDPYHGQGGSSGSAGQEAASSAKGKGKAKAVTKGKHRS